MLTPRLQGAVAGVHPYGLERDVGPVIMMVMLMMAMTMIHIMGVANISIIMVGSPSRRRWSARSSRRLWAACVGHSSLVQPVLDKPPCAVAGACAACTLPLSSSLSSPPPNKTLN